MQRKLNKQTITTEHDMLAVNELKFFYQNPRVYSVLRPIDGIEPTQEEIFEVMSHQEHVKDLKKDIKSTGGLTEAVIVKKNTMEVVEGNSRLAAYRLLYDESPMDWTEISCEILPEEITENQIHELIGKVHMSGKKKWDPFEEAGWLWRLSNEENKTMPELKQLFGWSSDKIKNYIKTYQFMLDKNLTEKSEFSHYLVLNTNPHIKKLKKVAPDIDDLIVEKVQTGEIKRADMIRDDLPVIANAPPKLVKKFVQGELDFGQALKFCHELGVDQVIYKKLNEFNGWLIANDDSIRNTQGNELEQVKYSLKKIRLNVQNFLDHIEGGD